MEGWRLIVHRMIKTNRAGQASRKSGRDVDSQHILDMNRRKIGNQAYFYRTLDSGVLQNRDNTLKE